MLKRAETSRRSICAVWCSRAPGGDRVGPVGPALCRPDVITHYARCVATHSFFSRLKGRRKSPATRRLRLALPFPPSTRQFLANATE